MFAHNSVNICSLSIFTHRYLPIIIQFLYFVDKPSTSFFFVPLYLLSFWPFPQTFPLVLFQYLVVYHMTKFIILFLCCTFNTFVFRGYRSHQNYNNFSERSVLAYRFNHTIWRNRIFCLALYPLKEAFQF